MAGMTAQLEDARSCFNVDALDLGNVQDAGKHFSTRNRASWQGIAGGQRLEALAEQAKQVTDTFFRCAPPP